MKKNVKRFLSMLLVLCMMFSLVVPVGATGTHDHKHYEEAKTASTDKDYDFSVEDFSTVVPLMTSGGEADKEDPAIIALEKELKEIMVLGADGEPVPMTEEQIGQVLYMFQQYLDQWEANANLLGVQVPFFLQYNDNGEDGLGILGEMLAMDKRMSLDALRMGYITFDDITGMIMNFYYADQLGIKYYGSKIASMRDEVLKEIEESGAVTEAQKILVLNDWLAHNVTFDMPYIMNTDKEEGKKPMVAENPQEHENYKNVYDVMYAVYEAQIRDTFEGQIVGGLKAEMKNQFYIAAIEQGVYDSVLEQATAAAIEEALPQVTEAVRQQVYNEAYAAAKEAIEQQIWDEAYAEYLAAHHAHAYNDVWTWTQAEDGTWTATVTVTCTAGEEVYENVAAEIVIAEGETLTWAPTCTAAGQTTYAATAKIKDAADVEATFTNMKQVSVDALGHDYDEETGVCSRCGATSEDHVHNYNTTFYWNYDETTGEVTVVEFEATCTTCSDKVEREATLTENSRTEPTCTEAGNANVTAAVVLEGTPVVETKDVVLAAKGHTEIPVAAVEPTCTETGMTAGVVCEVCENVISGCEIVPAAGHTEETVPAKAATCTETGLTEGVVCSVCDAVITAPEEIPVIPHDFVDGECSVCGAADPDYVAHEHVYNEEVVTEPTCQTPGKKVLSCECGDSKEEEIPTVPHQETYPGSGICTWCYGDIPTANDHRVSQSLYATEEEIAAAEAAADAAVEAAAETIAEQADAAAAAEADKYVEENAEAIQQMAADAVANDADAQAQLKAAAESETEKFMTENKAAIEADPVAFADSFGEEAAAEMAAAWDATWADWEANGIPGMVSMFAGQIWPKVIEQFYIQGMTQQGLDEATAAAEAAKIVEADAEAINADPYAYCVEKFGEEGAAQAQAVVNDQLTQMGIDPSTETNPEGRVKLEIIVALQMDTPQQDPMLQKPDGSYMTPNEAIPVFADQAAVGLTEGILNYWQGSQFGALGRGTAVCLGYTKAFTYLMQYMHPEVYGVNGANTDMSKSENWKVKEDLYYTDGELDVTKNYIVDDVRITFNANVTMYGVTQENFNSDHFWNAVQVDGQWYYVDPCYTDVYTEVMIRDRVETDGDMNHMYFMFSHSTAAQLYDGYYSDIKTLYGTGANAETDFGSDKVASEAPADATDYEDSWISRIKSNTYFDGGYAYYIYDSTDLITVMDDYENNNNFDTESMSEFKLKLVRHKLTTTDAGSNGDTDYQALIEFNYKADEDDDETIARVYDPESGKMVENVLLTKLYAQHEEYNKIYPSLSISMGLYNGKAYFNISNVIVSYDIATGEVEIVKEYNTVYGLRDKTNPFGGMAFSVSDSSNYDFVIENHPIAAMTIKADGKMYVSVATNFAFISGKDPHNSEDQSSFGYEFEESNFNAAYSNYGTDDEANEDMYETMGYTKEINDNDEFMWSANFVETLSMSHLAGTRHTYEEVTVDAYCGRNAYTENRCTTCGASEPDSRVEVEDSAITLHHYVKFEETFYTKGDDGNWNTGRCYVCTICGFSITEPTEPQKNNMISDEEYEEQMELYEKELAIYEEAVATAGHDYVPTDAVWADDDSTVTFSILECSANCPERNPYIDCLLGDDTITITLEEALTVETSVLGTIGTCEEGVTLIVGVDGELEVEFIEDKPETISYTISKEVPQEPGVHQYENCVCSICGDFTVKRIFGDRRSATAIEVADALKEKLEVDYFNAIIVANGDNFADALAGSYLAKVKGAPILLRRNSGDGDQLNKDYIAANLAEGGIIYILGGPVSIPQSVEDELIAADYKVVRLYGDTRFVTNLKILEEAGISEDQEILISAGWQYADCLSASATGLPIVMVDSINNVLTADQIAFFEKHAGNKFTIIGGTAAVDEKLEEAIEEIVGTDINRVFGATREETSVEVAKHYFADVDLKYAFVAYSRMFPDGLCGGPLANAYGAPLLLINSGRESFAADYVAEEGIAAGFILGGTSVVTEESAKAVFGITSEEAIPSL